ncbi:MAG: triose-phosphate isomerase [Candidatus Aenigmatarchaeota archaeon]
MKLPLLLVNFKTYEKGTGRKAEGLAKTCEMVSEEAGKNIVPVVQVSDLYRVSNKVDIPVYAQRIDPVNYGSNTGHVLPKGLKENGASGVVINHSEDRRDMEVIESCIKKASGLGFDTLVCAESPEEAGKISDLEPDMVAIEPPELIGGDVSVSSARPEVITDSLERVNRPLICGAGIKSKEDVEKALELGARGVFVASGIVKAEDPEERIKELVEPF